MSIHRHNTKLPRMASLIEKIKGKAEHKDHSEIDANAEVCISVHNKARGQKGCSALQWDDNLAKDAQAYAEKLAAMNKMVRQTSFSL